MEISLFLKENDPDILIVNETWLKSKFSLDIPNYNITAMIDLEGKVEVLLSLCVTVLISISLTHVPLMTPTTKPLLLS